MPRSRSESIPSMTTETTSQRKNTVSHLDNASILPYNEVKPEKNLLPGVVPVAFGEEMRTVRGNRQPKHTIMPGVSSPPGAKPINLENDNQNTGRRKRSSRNISVIDYSTIGIESFAFGEADADLDIPSEEMKNNKTTTIAKKRLAKTTTTATKSPSPTKREIAVKRKLDVPVDDDSFMVKLKTKARRTAKSQDHNEMTENNISDSLSDKQKTKLVIKLPKKSSNEANGAVDPTAVSSTMISSDSSNDFEVKEEEKEEEDDDDEAIDNEDFCSACGGLGNFLCCERCPKSFHFTCLNPPLESHNLPEGEWFCPECVAMRTQPIIPTRGIFSNLLSYTAKKNPFQFMLPKNMVKGTRSSLTIESPASIKLETQITPITTTVVKSEILPDTSEMLLRPPSENNNNTTSRYPRAIRIKREKAVVPENQDHIIKSEKSNLPMAVKLPTPPFLDSEYENGRVKAKISKLVNRNFGSETIIYRLPENGVILDFIETVENQNMMEPSVGKWTPANTLLALDKFAEEGFIEKAYLKEESKLRFGLNSYKADIGNVYFLQSENMNVEAIQLEQKKLAEYNMKEDIDSLLETALNTTLQPNVFDSPSSDSDLDDDEDEDKDESDNGIITIKSDSSSDSSDKTLRLPAKNESMDNGTEHMDLLAIKRLIKLKGRNSLMEFLHSHKK